METDEVVTRLFEKLKAAMGTLKIENPDMHWDQLGGILWWALDSGARRDDIDAGYLVTLRTPVKDGDEERTLMALGMIRGVVGVHPIPENSALHMAEVRVRSRLMGMALGRDPS